MGWNLKKLGQRLISSFNAYAGKKHQKNYGYCSLMKFVWCLLHKSSGGFLCMGFKVITSTQNYSKITISLWCSPLIYFVIVKGIRGTFTLGITYFILSPYRRACKQIHTIKRGWAMLWIACEQALLFGWAKRVSWERASERQSPEAHLNRRACSHQQMPFLAFASLAKWREVTVASFCGLSVTKRQISRLCSKENWREPSALKL